ncbi:DUF1190 domain-containing protein [Croceibacterium ferulae]|uniref:DUF1190 domain-containing protein n=1 Tax=Croceibacterium ferulae TaxID=1854641 RepID=UPI000EB32AE4|nr:DUF1190 domain-containing protein [Croceibacterium ferulae]
MVTGKPVRPRRFARSVPLPLALGGLGVAAGLSLSGCALGAPAELADAPFSSIAECTAAGYPQGLCAAGYRTAAEEHENTVPRFDSLAACQEDWGSDSCAPATDSATAPGNDGTTQRASSGMMFAPALAGFVLGRSLQRNYARDCRRDEDCDRNYRLGRYGGGAGLLGQPIYRDRTGRAVASQLTRNGQRLTPVTMNSRTVARGGFGSRGGSRFGG